MKARAQFVYLGIAKIDALPDKKAFDSQGAYSWTYRVISDAALCYLWTSLRGVPYRITRTTISKAPCIHAEGLWTQGSYKGLLSRSFATNRFASMVSQKLGPVHANGPVKTAADGLLLLT